jgi:hypothetical protein
MISRVELLGGAQSVSASTVNSRCERLDPARGISTFWRRSAALDVLRRQRVSREAIAVEPDAHRVAAARRR